MSKKEKSSSLAAATGTGTTPSAPDEDLYHKFLDFLKSPMWILPVMSFVEQRSVVFDKEQGDEKLYKPIHDEFRNLVDMLIQCFCDDLGVKPQHVARTIKHDTSQKPRSKVEWTCLEPVLAASDYNLFVHMMMRKNIELQLQALQMIEIMCGLIPAVLMPGASRGAEKRASAGGGGGGERNAEDQERMILIQVMRRSKEDYEKEKSKDQESNAALDRAMRESMAEKEKLEAERRREENLIHQALKLSLSDNERDEIEMPVAAKGGGDRKSSIAVVKEPKRELPALKTRAMSVSGGEVTLPYPAKNNAEASWDLSKSGPPSKMDVKLKQRKDEISESALADRRLYLTQQRDKLLSMKREARERAFADAEIEAGRTRPKTARAAKSAIRGRGRIAGEATDDVLAARRALVEKLKHEVMGVQ